MFAPLTAIYNKLGSTVLCLFHHFQAQGLLDLSHLESVVCLRSSGPAFQLWLLTAHCDTFSTNQATGGLISDTGADITVVYLCLQDLAIYFIWAGKMFYGKLLRAPQPELYRQRSQRLHDGSVATAPIQVCFYIS